MRPCGGCEKWIPGKPFDVSQCRACWLYHNDAKYKAFYDAPAPPTPPPKTKTHHAAPGLIAQGLTFAKAVVRHAANGFERVTDDQLAARLTICHGCEFFQHDTCSLCGCGLNIKATWKSEDCPKGKWPKV